MNLFNIEQEKIKSVNVGGYDFKIKAILPKERLSIIKRKAQLQQGQAIDSIQVDDFLFLDSVAVVDVGIEDTPKDFNKNESCLNWADTTLIFELADEIKKHTDYINSELKKNRPVRGIEQA